MTRSFRTVWFAAALLILAFSAQASTTVLYQGPTSLTFGRDTFVRAAAFTTETGVPLTGATITFTLGATSAGATVDNYGFASTVLHVGVTPGASVIQVAFAGDALHAPGATTVPVRIVPQPSALMIQSDAGIPAGAATNLVAMLMDNESGQPIAGKLLHFSIGPTGGDALTDGNGLATLSVQVPAGSGLGAQSLTVTFGGDLDVLPSAETQTAYVYEPAPFVIWGGNTGGVRDGDHVVFLAPDWSKQVAAGDYQAGADFKGFIDTAKSPAGAATCATCWTAKPGDMKAPANKKVIGVVVATSIVRKQNRISGNTAAIAIIQVDPTSTTTRRTGTVLHLPRVERPE